MHREHYEDVIHRYLSPRISASVPVLGSRARGALCLSAVGRRPPPRLRERTRDGVHRPSTGQYPTAEQPLRPWLHSRPSNVYVRTRKCVDPEVFIIRESCYVMFLLLGR